MGGHKKLDARPMVLFTPSKPVLLILLKMVKWNLRKNWILNIEWFLNIVSYQQKMQETIGKSSKQKKNALVFKKNCL